jgi:uncharacterized membrane-anchored protein YhcB (DUF1043 family)
MFVNWKEMFVNWEANLFWLILGSLVTFLITWIYGRSSRKSHKETQRLLDLVLRGLESESLRVEYSYDKSGRVVDIVIKGSINAVVQPVTASITGIVEPPPSGKP